MNRDQLSIEIRSPVHVDDTVRFGAVGLRDADTWSYAWRVRGPGGVDVGRGRLTTADVRFHTTALQKRSRWVDFRATDIRPGVYTVQVKATKRGTGPRSHTATAALEVVASSGRAG
jgi:hypothetical protein